MTDVTRTPVDVEAAKRLADAATEGPWLARTHTDDAMFARIDGPSWPVAQVLHDYDARPVTSELQSARERMARVGLMATMPGVN